VKITAVKTDRLQAGQQNLEDVVAAAVPQLGENSVLVVTSKIVSLCDSDIVEYDQIDKEELVRLEADKYLPRESSKYGHRFTIKNNTLIASAGIDESNADGVYVLWPKQVQATANRLRSFLQDHYAVNNCGVLIVDSSCTPLRRGTTGIYLAFSGFKALKNYVGTPDIFGKKMQVSHSSIAGGLAAAGVVVMGEGSEQTPLAIIEDANFVEFTDQDPTHAELKECMLSPEEDLFEPFLSAVDWQNKESKS